MKKTDFSDGICNTCGNPGLAGDRCMVCGDIMSKIDEGLNDPISHREEDDFGADKESDVYPLEMVDKEEKLLDEEV